MQGFMVSVLENFCKHVSHLAQIQKRVISVTFTLCFTVCMLILCIIFMITHINITKINKYECFVEMRFSNARSTFSTH